MSLIFSAYPAARALLFSMDAEDAHDLSLYALKKIYDCRFTAPFIKTQALTVPVSLMGLTFRNPVGLAAGLDKNGSCIDALGSLGFGFVEVGTVTPKPQAGNSRPRLFRLRESQAIINRMGFNNQGLEAFIENVKVSKWRDNGGVLGLNIGKNASTPNSQAVSDYMAGLDAVYPYADYITVNISSPNTENLRNLQSGSELDGLLKALQNRRLQLAEEYGVTVPLAVKVAPDLVAEQIEVMAHTLLEHKIDGVIATNTTLSRDGVQGLRYSDETGGLSGPPVHELSLQVISSLRHHLGPDLAIIGAGGIHSGMQAKQKIQAGANAVQLYTGLIYKGPKLIAECVKAIQEQLY